MKTITSGVKNCLCGTQPTFDDVHLLFAYAFHVVYRGNITTLQLQGGRTFSREKKNCQISGWKLMPPKTPHYELPDEGVKPDIGKGIGGKTNDNVRTNNLSDIGAFIKPQIPKPGKCIKKSEQSPKARNIFKARRQVGRYIAKRS